jgi:hypothetical protein
MSKFQISPPQCGESPAVFPVIFIFILRLLRNLLAKARQKVLLLRPEEIFGMEECKMPVWARDKMYHNRRFFLFPKLQFSRG